MPIDPDATFWLWQLLGRLHPLVVHFPIALLITAFFLELLTLGGRRDGLRPGIEWLVYLGAASAAAAAAQGWLLALEDYGGTAVLYHRWLGTSTAVLAAAAALLLRRALRPGSGRSSLHAYRAVLALSAVAMTVTGHLGASMTHGPEFLTAVLPWNAPEATSEDHRAVLTELTLAREAGRLSEEQLAELNLEVRALFAHTCYRCHSSDKRKADLELDSREGVMRGGESGPILVPGNAAASEIVRRLELPRDHEEAMPAKGEALPRASIDLVRLWIDEGAYWTDRAVQTFPEAELALRRPPLPAASEAGASPVDRLVGAYFDARGLAWPEPVGDALFIRRVYLDLVGVLPGPEEVDAFVADAAPDKRDRLVDQLLGREHAYAQHWLSFWNDLLRNDYTGTGFITGGRRQITDWLYDALRTNKPYDVMVRELLAPDEASEGFIRGIQWRGAVNASQRVEMQAAQNVSQALLGLNLKCASCHNSFVSNRTLDEAYAFANVFADTVLQIYRCDKPTGRWARTGFIYPELGEIDGDLPRSERLERLADVVVQPENGRLSRTIVNRLWARLMGRGLVEPLDEMDNPPWSQELLDWLAAELVSSGYDLKHLIGTIARSRAYGLASVGLERAEQVTDEAFVFHGPLRRRLSAEQFADALSQTVAPAYFSVAYDPFEVELPAEWIWYDAQEFGRQALPAPGTYYFRRSFTLSEQEIRALDAAELLVSVDHAFRLYVNGERVGEGADWRKVARIDAAEALRPGVNVLAVEGQNEGTVPNPAGILLSLRIAFDDGRLRWVRSDREWKASARAPEEGWLEPGFDDRLWEDVRSFGRHASNRHWGRLLAFTHAPKGHPMDFARASLVENDAFLKVLGRPSREIVVTRRDDEATLLQALELTNGAFLSEVVERGAERWAQRYGAEPERMVRRLYRQALARPPTRAELRAGTAALEPRADAEAVEDLLWAVVLLPEFQLIY